ncbi:MAG: metallophosphoesterase [Phycisphaerae bacterium]|nr:metallophosphoesterase [Phycisphaerae bacterium]
MTDLSDGHKAAETLREVARLNREDPNRSGSLLTFGSAGQLVMTGDMHGYTPNFDKLQHFCALRQSPGRSVILHELIHYEPDPPGLLDLSIDLLVRAAAWKCEYPDNIFFLQSNHELSQLRGHEITKGGRYVLADFDRGVEYRYGSAAGEVLAAVKDFIASFPLAARTANGIFLAHSLPDPLFVESFDLSVFDREPTDGDYAPGGPAYALVWGRFQTPDEVAAFAQRLGVEHLIVGHTPQEMGYLRVGRMLILASDHPHGVFLPIDLSRTYTQEQLDASIRKFVSVE